MPNRSETFGHFEPRFEVQTDISTGGIKYLAEVLNTSASALSRRGRAHALGWVRRAQSRTAAIQAGHRGRRWSKRVAMAVTRGLGPHPVVRGFPGKVCCSPVHLAHFSSSAAPRYICTYVARMPAPVRCSCTPASPSAAQDLTCEYLAVRRRCTECRLHKLHTTRDARLAR